jgi:hypothetical protein
LDYTGRLKLLLLLLPVLALGQTVTPTTAVLGPNQTQQFKAVCTTCTVNWGIDTQWCGSDGVNAGVIDQTGLYTAPATITLPQTVHVSAIVDGAFSCAATVSLQPTPSPPPPPPPATYPGVGPGLIFTPDPNGGPGSYSADLTVLFYRVQPPNAPGQCAAGVPGLMVSTNVIASNADWIWFCVPEKNIAGSRAVWKRIPLQSIP